MPYYQLLLEQNLTVLSLWPKPVAVFQVADVARLYSAGGCSSGIRIIIAFASSLCCWGIYNATQLRRTTLLRSLFLFVGLLQMAFYVNYLRGKDTFANVHLYLDVGINLYYVTPQLVMGLTGLPIEAYVLFIGGHVVAASLLYFHIANMSWYFAVLRALGVHSLAMFAALVVHKRVRTIISNSHVANQQQQERQQLLQHGGLSKAGGAKQSSMAVAHPLLAAQIVSWPAISTKAVRRLMGFLSQGRSAPRLQAQVEPEVHQEQQQHQQQQQQQCKMGAMKMSSSAVDQEQVQPQYEQQQQQQQRHSTGAPKKSSSGADQVQAQQQQQQQQMGALRISRRMDPLQQSASKCIASKSLGRDTSSSSFTSTRQTHQASGSSNPVMASDSSNPVLASGSSNPVLASGCSNPVLASGSSNPVQASGSFDSKCQAQNSKCEALGCFNPVLKKAIVEAALVLGDRRNQEKPFTSKLDNQCSCPDPNKTLQRVQQSCRFIVKLNGILSPDHIPEGGVAQLQHKLQRYQCLAPAVRSGCLVISYDTAPFGPGCTLEEMSKEVLAEAKEWAQEQGLLEPGEDSLTVQACPTKHWDSGLDGQSPPVYCMAVHTPFLVPNSDGLTPASLTQKQPLQQQQHQARIEYQVHAENQPPECVQEQGALCGFELTIRAPDTDLELRGWQGAADAPEDLPDAVKSRSLSLLATLGGHFLSVTVEKESLSKSGERVVQVCVRLPADSLDIVSSCPQPLMLELWAAGTLVCCYSALLVPPSSTSAGAAALAELQGWAAGLTGTHPEDSGPFTRDLVRWLRFQACSQQEQQASIAAKDADLLDGPMQQQQQQQLELMKAVGVDLLEYSLSQGMEGVAGLLLERFASFPFCIPPLILLDTLSAVRPEDQPCAPPASTLHSSSHLNATLHSCPSPAAPAPSTSTAATPATTHSSALACIVAALSAVSCKLAAVARGLCAQPSKEEADYRAWSNAQVAPLAKFWCRLSVLHICVGALRVACTEGMSPLLALSSWGTILLGYIVGALFIQPGSPSSEVILVAVAVARASHCTALGLGLISISGTDHLLCSWRVEVVAEVLIMSLMERVRLNWMVPLRALLAVSTWLVYVRMGLPCPATQSVLVNLCSLGVTAAMEWRCRRLYSSPRLQAKQQACDAHAS